MIEKNKECHIFTGRAFNAYRSRVPVAKIMQQKGYDVFLYASSDPPYDEEITKLGFKFIKLEFYRHGINFFRDILTIIRTLKIMALARSQLIHAFNPKPVMVTGLVAHIVKPTRYCVTLTGLGNTGSKGLRNKIINSVYKLSLKNAKIVFVENNEDKNYIIKNNIAEAEKIFVSIASGVDLSCYPFDVNRPKINRDILNVTFASRLVWSKGVRELLEASKELNRIFGKAIQIKIAGEYEPYHPEGVPQTCIEVSRKNGDIEYLGRVSATELPKILLESDVVVLPSYREGFSKILMEGAAAGNALVATNIPGCRELIRDGVNGYMVAAKNVPEIVEAIKKIFLERATLDRMKKNSRADAELLYDIKIVAVIVVNQYEKNGLLE